MTRHIGSKKSALAREILDTVPRDRLVAAVGFILAHRQARAAGLPDLPDENSGEAPILVDRMAMNDVETFLSTASARQLRLLRKIALGLEVEVMTQH